MVLRISHILITVFMLNGIAGLNTTRYELQVQDSDVERHPCERECTDNGEPMTCHYVFKMEWYTTMSRACFDCPNNETDCFRKDCITGDGFRRPVIVVNRQMPGPSIQVCYGDTVIVDLENDMPEESTSIHWHGHHQRGSPYMDGVPYITQCPVHPHSAFRYKYEADAPGTHFWHSHSGCQRADGAFGSLIIRKPPSLNPHVDLYDFDLFEHTIQILDWGHITGTAKFVFHHHAGADNKPCNILVNGRGRPNRDPSNFCTIAKDLNISVPVSSFTVEQGYRYRFRIINAGFLNVPIEVSVDNHTIIVISTDGNDIEPVEADSLVTYAGERFDFIINASEEIGNYWIRFRGLMDGGEVFSKVHQVAVLHYEGAAEDEDPGGVVSYKESARRGLTINALNAKSGTEGVMLMPELKSIQKSDESLKIKPDHTFYIAYDFNPVDNPLFHIQNLYGFHESLTKIYTPQLNHISMMLPSFPLLSQRELITPDMFCNETTVTNCTEQFCQCTHVLSVPLGAVVEIVILDEGVVYDANHPFHLHGNIFRVVGMDRINVTTTLEEFKALDRVGAINRNLEDPPMKDTVTVPDGGYTILRLHATNPGYWFLHCHIEFHVEIGMALVFKVGEHSDFPPVPKDFPQCNKWLPPIQEDFSEIEEQEQQDEQIKHNLVITKNESSYYSYSGESNSKGFLSPIISVLNLITHTSDTSNSARTSLPDNTVIIFLGLLYYLYCNKL